MVRVVLGVVGLVMIFVLTSSGSMTALATFESIAAVLDSGMLVLMIFGWWLFSTPDPSVSERNTGDLARQFVRIAVLVNGLAGILGNAGQSLQYSLAPGLAAIVAGLSLFILLIWLVSFVAGMVYIRWIGRRIPSERVEQRAKLLMWLGPLLSTVGLLCVGLGPLVTLVLYIMLIYWVRQDIGVVQEEQARRFA